MNFPVRRGTPLYQAQLQARALNAWRDAELVVRARWDAFLVADGALRGDAFAAYVADKNSPYRSSTLEDTHA